MTVSLETAAQPMLLADIGGTNCRLLLDDGSATIQDFAKVYSTDDFPSPAEAISAFLNEAGGAMPRTAALAVAGAVTGDMVRLTNTSWTFDRAALSEALGLDRLIIVNDLAAQARAVLELTPSQLVRIGKPERAVSDTVSIVGPGTGLGVARADKTGGEAHVTPTEGGHVGFAPHDEVETELLRLWRSHLGRVTNEHVISGPGLVRLYRALGALRDTHVEPIEGPEIMRRALAHADPLCVEAVERFAKILGAVCGDIALAQGAGAVVLVGGIANALEPVLQQGGFRARFEQRGPGGHFLATTPTHLAVAPDLGLAGARHLLLDELREASA